MKTSEMIAMLEQNPKLEFTYGEHINNKFGIDRVADMKWLLAQNWQLVREPVPWQEALQAWIDGKTVILDRCNCQKTSCNKCQFLNGKKVKLRSGDVAETICQEMLSTGTWVIEEGE